MLDRLDTFNSLKDGVSTSTFEYNWDGKLREASLDGTTVTVKYDPMGNRVLKSVNDGSTTTTRKYIVDITGKLPTILCEIDTDNESSLTKSYIYSNNSQILCQRDGEKQSDEYFYTTDRLGSVRLLIDDQGRVVANYTYSPFGQTLEKAVSATGPTNPFMFTGQWYDSEIKQYYLRARMYDPAMMRFTARDPVFGKFTQPLTFNEYLYCINDPINRIDPNGEFAFTTIAIRLFIGAAVGTLSAGSASDWDKKAMIIGGLSGMLSGAVPGRLLGVVAGSFLGGSSAAYAEYRQHGSWQSAVMGFSSGFGSGMITGGLMGGLGLLQNPGLATFISSQLFSSGASSYLGAANDGAADIIEYMEDHYQQIESIR